MNPLEKLVQEIEEAVIQAAYAVQKSNIDILSTYFYRVDDDSSEGGDGDASYGPGDPQASDPTPRNMRWSELFEDEPEFDGVYAPKTIAIQYPNMNPIAQKEAEIKEKHPHVPEPYPIVHTVYVPLISLAPPATYYVDEVTVRLNVEYQFDGTPEGEPVLTVAPASGRRPAQAVEDGSDEVGIETGGYVKIVVKRGEDSATKTEVIRGYDRATRAEIPG